ncbi:MAG: restriction endonuclease [Rhodospirillales bacterium]|nr:restriction endonuclease [Rhodospirillales bacterium]
MIERSKIVDRLHRLELQDRVYSVNNLVLMAIKDINGKYGLVDEENSNRYKSDFWNRIFIKQDRLMKRGLVAQFTAVDNEKKLLKWNDKLQKFSDTLKVRFRPFVLRFLDGLDDRDYEFACGTACRFLGAEKIFVTPPGNEFGIDFVALIPAYSRSTVVCSGKEGLRIIGQSKKYSSAISREKVSILINSIDMIKYRKPEITELLPSWFFSSRAPLVGWLVGHSGFQSGCDTYAQDHGIILSDAIELSDILSAPRILGYCTDISKIPAILAKHLDSIRLTCA